MANIARSGFDPFDESKSAAKFTDGVLELTLPKKAAAAAKRLTID